MIYHNYNYLKLCMLCLIIASCSATSVKRVPDHQHIAVANRFLKNIGAGEMVFAVIKREIEKEAKDRPNVADLLEQIFSDISEDAFVGIVANVYSRHLAQNHLEELAKFTEGSAGKRFFNAGFDVSFNDTQDSEEEFLRQFTADELIEIIKFSQSEAGKALINALPEINRELENEGEQFGAEIIQDFINNQ